MSARSSLAAVIAGAIALVASACSEAPATRVVEVDLVPTMPEDVDHVLATHLPTSVHVTVRGPPKEIERLGALDPVLIQLGAAPAHVYLSAASVQVPAGITVVAIDPAALDLAWEVLVRREVPLRVPLIGEPADGFALRGEPAADPPRVSILGPKAEVEAIQAIETAPFDINNLTEGAHTGRVSLPAAPGRVRYESLSVEARVEVGPIVAKRHRR